MSFFVLELQTVGNSGSVIPFAFDNKEDALSKAYSLASVAVKSEIETHTIMCVNAFGFNVIDPIVSEHTAKTTE